MANHTYELTWGIVALAGGGALATNIWGAAERFQAMSYAYRSWPASVTTCRAFGGVFAVIGAWTLTAAIF